MDPGIICFQHCEPKIFCLNLPEACPACSIDLNNGNFTLMPFRVPYPFVRASQYPCSVIIKPTIGDFLNDYYNSMDLHIGVTNSSGVIIEFDKHGLRQRVCNDWDQSLLLDQVSLPWQEHWDHTLTEICQQSCWKAKNYNEDTNNCYSFVLSFLIELDYGDLSIAAANRTLFCEKYIVSRTTSAGINGTDAQKYIQKHNIALLEHHRLKNTLNFMKQERFNVNEILKHPKIFKQCGHKPWEHYFTYFKECGCKEIPISNLLKKIRYSPIKLLKDRGILPTDTIVVQNLQDNLDIALDKTDIIRLNNDDHSLSYVHREVTHKYLEKRLGATQSDIEKISRIHYQIYNKSLKKLCENLNIALEIGYTKEKILRNPYILQVKPENTRELFEKLPQLINCDIQSELKRYPKLIGLSMDNVNAIYDILKKNEISDAAIKKNMNIFTLSPKTVLERIEDIKSTPDTRVLMANPRTLRLIIHYHRARDRLQFLHKFKLKCSCVLVIGFQDKIFDHYIKEGKDKNSSREVGDFLHALLKYDKADLEVNFRKHPYYLYVPFTEIEDTYLYLKQVQFEDCHIISAISILLYPKEKIINALNTIKEDHYLSTRKPRVNKRKILNLALYYLEKDHHFSGNGIWRVNDVYSPQ